MRAAWNNLRVDGKIKQGGSTITQQIIKQTLLAGEEADVSDLGAAADERAPSNASSRSTGAR